MLIFYNNKSKNLPRFLLYPTIKINQTRFKSQLLQFIFLFDYNCKLKQQTLRFPDITE